MSIPSFGDDSHPEGPRRERTTTRIDQTRLPSIVLIFCLAGIAIIGWRLWLPSVAAQPPRTAGKNPFQAFDLQSASIPRAEIHHGGPPVDGIPALTNPRFVAADEATYLRPEDRIIGVTIEGSAKAYPLRILNYHEVVNDQIGNHSFAVTYCPLCDSALAVNRRVEQAHLSSACPDCSTTAMS